MWQLSFPMEEEEAKALCSGAQALKKEACRRTQWHEPSSDFSGTQEAQVSAIQSMTENYCNQSC
jgi:hypothetical protein